MTGSTAPLIVTLTLDPATQERFDELRRQHFPADRNYLGAHVTLFHALPGERVDDIMATLLEVTSSREAFEVTVTAVRMLGRGVAYDLRSPELDRVHAELAGVWRDQLTRQDSQPFRAHVTVQNKVDPATARALHASLSATFVPLPATATGLDVWWYVGGPWRHERTVLFGARRGPEHLSSSMVGP